MAANREVVQRRNFAKGFIRNFSVFLAFYKSTTLKRKPKFSTVRSTVGRDFDAKPRNSAQRTAKAKLRITYHRQCCAKQRNDAQLVRLELEIRCSIRLSYGRRIRTDIYRVFRRIKATEATR